MKKIIKLMLLLVLLITVNIRGVHAETKIEENNIKVTTIEIIANAPDGFDKDIYVNFLLANGTNKLYILKRDEGYIYNGTIQVGEAKINFVNIINNNNEYSYSCLNSLKAEEGEKAKFDIDIEKSEDNKNTSKLDCDKIPDSENPQKSKDNIGGNHTQEELESTLIEEEKNDNQESKEERKEPTKNDNKKNTDDEGRYDTNDDKNNPIKELLKNNIVSIVVILVVILAAAMLSKKDKEW